MIEQTRKQHWLNEVCGWIGHLVIVAMIVVMTALLLTQSRLQEALCGSSPTEQLGNAIDQGDVAQVQHALASGANLEDFAGSTALIHAAALSQPDVLKCLLQAKANPNAVRKRLTPVCVAVNFHQEQILQLLLDAGASPDGPEGTIPPLAILIQEVADHSGDATDSWVEIRKSQCRSMIQCLLEAGADGNRTDNQGNTPLSLARSTGQLEYVALFDKY